MSVSFVQKSIAFRVRKHLENSNDDNRVTSGHCCGRTAASEVVVWRFYDTVNLKTELPGLDIRAIFRCAQKSRKFSKFFVLRQNLPKSVDVRTTDAFYAFRSDAMKLRDLNLNIAYYLYETKPVKNRKFQNSVFNAKITKTVWNFFRHLRTSPILIMCKNRDKLENF